MKNANPEITKIFNSLKTPLDKIKNPQFILVIKTIKYRVTEAFIYQTSPTS